MLVIAPVCYTVARPKLSWEVTQTVLPLALVNVLNVVCGLVGERPSSASGCMHVCLFVLTPKQPLCSRADDKKS